MSAKEVRFYSENFAYCTDFVFEEVAQRFEKLHFHVVWEASDVVMAFDYSAAAVTAFYDVGVYCALKQPIGAAEFAGFFFKYSDEEGSYDFAFFLGFSYAFEGCEESFFGIDMVYVEVK